jgi:hypothetical protein
MLATAVRQFCTLAQKTSWWGRTRGVGGAGGSGALGGAGALGVAVALDGAGGLSALIAVSEAKMAAKHCVATCLWNTRRRNASTYPAWATMP